MKKTRDTFACKAMHALCTIARIIIGSQCCKLCHMTQFDARNVAAVENDPASPSLQCYTVLCNVVQCYTQCCAISRTVAQYHAMLRNVAQYAFSFK